MPRAPAQPALSIVSPETTGGADHGARGRFVRGHGQAALHLPTTTTRVLEAQNVRRVRSVVRAARRAERRAWLQALGMAVCRPPEPEARGLSRLERGHRRPH